ncbi:MAG: hypothetical protein DCC68_01935 [Planctomycetota bacterium]|nr:MAG: hypothetical protein DCC68_01935 [Planctomycetota bacterium]
MRTAIDIFADEAAIDTSHTRDQHTDSYEQYEYHYDEFDARRREKDRGLCALTFSPELDRFEHDVRALLRAPAREKRVARDTVVSKIRNSSRSSEERAELRSSDAIKSLIRLAVSSRRAGRLDDAIDVLSQVGPILELFIKDEYLRETTPGVNDDYWYVVLRAIGKSGLQNAFQLVECLWRNCPEAAVEALGEIDDERAVDKLRNCAADGSADENVRAMANDILDEIGTI